MRDQLSTISHVVLTAATGNMCLPLKTKADDTPDVIMLQLAFKETGGLALITRAFTCTVTHEYIHGGTMGNDCGTMNVISPETFILQVFITFNNIHVCLRVARLRGAETFNLTL